MAPSFGLRKKKNTKKKVLIISGISAAVLLIAAFLLTLIYTGNKPICDRMQLSTGLLGCNADEEYVFDKIAFVVGDTKNVPTPALTEEAEKFIRNSSYNHKVQINVYSAASNYRTLLEDMPSREEDDNEDPAEAIDARVASVKEAIKTPPTANGAQYLDAIIDAAEEMTSRKAKILIIVIGSGLSDGGILDFTKGDLLNSDPNAVVQEMRNSGTLVLGRLSDVSIYWSGIGKVKVPQAELTEPEKKNLKKLYQSVLTRMGAEVIDIVETAGHADSVKTDYYVKPIPTKGYACLWCDEKTFDSSVIGFAEDKAELNEQAAMKVLGGLIDEMKKNQHETVSIWGYVSLIKHDCSIARSRNVDGELARKRAYAVKNFLEKHGISADRIAADKGPGDSKGPEDECAGGRYNPEKAKKNMIITIKASV